MAVPHISGMIGSTPTVIMTEPTPPVIVKDPIATETLMAPLPSGPITVPNPINSPTAPTLQVPPTIVPPMPNVSSTNSLIPLDPTPLPMPGKTAAETPGWKQSSGVRPVSGSERSSFAELPSTTQRVSYSEPTALASATFDRARDYSWLVGTLEPGRQAGSWCVRFCSLDEEDQYGGSVVLTDVADTTNFVYGQRVRVEGEIVNADVARTKPGYKVRSINFIK